jgi:hypothetical protein
MSLDDGNQQISCQVEQKRKITTFQFKNVNPATGNVKCPAVLGASEPRFINISPKIKSYDLLPNS